MRGLAPLVEEELATGTSECEWAQKEIEVRRAEGRAKQAFQEEKRPLLPRLPSAVLPGREG